MAHDDGSVCECIVNLQDEGLSANAGGGWWSVPVATEVPEEWGKFEKIHLL
jgi:hypothetical protein